jgi:D-alanyl-D-alanine carboxypeptidase (penicillin-binding protein 5/6)
VSQSTGQSLPPTQSSQVNVAPSQLNQSVQNIQWPPSPIESAVGVVGSGVLATSGDNIPKPLASVTKLMTAYIILKDYPLSSTSNGFSYTATQLDQQEWAQAVSQGDSESKIVAGEVLTERQLLTYLLVPSADNVALILARIDAKTVSSFVVKMNAQAALLGMKNTDYVDPSGLSPGDISTAYDQTLLAMALISNPVVKQIVDQPFINFPISGWQQSTNPMLGVDGTFGIKTGYTPQAGGVLVFATPANFQGKILTVVGALIGLAGTFSILRQLAKYGQIMYGSFVKGLSLVNFPSDSFIGRIYEKGSTSESLQLSVTPISFYAENGTLISFKKKINKLNKAMMVKGSVIGTIYVTVGNINNYVLKIYTV